MRSVVQALLAVLGALVGAVCGYVVALVVALGVSWVQTLGDSPDEQFSNEGGALIAILLLAMVVCAPSGALFGGWWTWRRLRP